MNPKDIYRSFLEETKDHQIRVENDNGVHRSVLCAEPGTGIYHYRLNTWPGHLAISGDISDGLIFTRLHDMFEFFRSEQDWDDIDFRYWAEKLTGGSRSVQEYDPELAKAYVQSEIDNFIEYKGLEDNPEWAERLRYEANQLGVEFGPDVLCNQMYSFVFYPLKDDPYHEVFTDIETTSWYDYNYRFYLNCFAIQAGIKAYNRYKSGGEDTWLHQESLLQDHGITRTKPSSESS